MRIDETEFKAILKGLKGLPKEASAQIRKESNIISDEIIIPRIQDSMRQHMPANIADRMAASVRKKSDRIPTVSIGYKKKVFSGGASTVVMRYGTIVGSYTSRSGREVKWPEKIVTPGWTGRASDLYLEPAYRLWTERVGAIVAQWNRGKNG